MDSHNCGGELIPGVVMLKRSGSRYGVDGFRCSHCGEEIVGRDTALSIEKLERERDELLAACELALEAICAGAEGWMLSEVELKCRIAIAKVKGEDDA